MNPLHAWFEYYLEQYKKLITVGVVALIVVLTALYLIGANVRTSTTVEENTTLAESIRTGTAPIPEYTPATAAKLAASTGFAAIVSYTDNGFEPAVVTIRAGEGVRFTNNSSANLWIAASGNDVAVYPRTETTCGSSGLDSCEPFSPQDFWEFSFDAVGEWHVINNLNKSKNGVVIVK